MLRNDRREHFLKYLNKNKINAVISYTPLHKSKAGKEFHKDRPKLKNSDKFINRIIRLPLHNYLTLSEVDYITKKIKEYFYKK